MILQEQLRLKAENKQLKERVKYLEGVVGGLLRPKPKESKPISEGVLPKVVGEVFQRLGLKGKADVNTKTAS